MRNMFPPLPLRWGGEFLTASQSDHANEMRKRCRFHFFHHARAMGFNCFDADFEVVGNGLVHLASHHCIEHLPLAIGQRCEPCSNARDLALLRLRFGGELESLFDAFQ